MMGPLDVLRHTCAMQLLQAGIDRSVIALWLGHESVETTQIYLHADLEMKERALALIPSRAPGLAGTARRTRCSRSSRRSDYAAHRTCSIEWRDLHVRHNPACGITALMPNSA